MDINRKQPETARCTQEPDEQAAAQSTKSDGLGQMDAMKAVVQIELKRLEHIDMNKLLASMSDDEQPATIKTGGWFQVQGTTLAHLPSGAARVAPVDERQLRA